MGTKEFPILPFRLVLLCGVNVDWEGVAMKKLALMILVCLTFGATGFVKTTERSRHKNR